MDLKKLNNILEDLEYLNEDELKFIRREDIHLGVSGNSYGGSDGVQGEEDSWYMIYKIKSEPDLYLKIKYFSDSYGYGSFIRGIQFVSEITKKVKTFEKA